MRGLLAKILGGRAPNLATRRPNRKGARSLRGQSAKIWEDRTPNSSHQTSESGGLYPLESSTRGLSEPKTSPSEAKRLDGSLGIERVLGRSLPFCAEGGIRTHTESPPLNFESSVSTSFTTSAAEEKPKESHRRRASDVMLKSPRCLLRFFSLPKPGEPPPARPSRSSAKGRCPGTT